MSKNKLPWTYVVQNFGIVIGVYTSCAHCVALVKWISVDWEKGWQDIPGCIEVFRYRPSFGCSDSLNLEREDITSIVLKAV